VYGYFFPYNSSPVLCKKKQLFLLHLVILLGTINLNLFILAEGKGKYNEVGTNISQLKQTNANVHVSMISTMLFTNQNRERILVCKMRECF